MLNLAYRTLIDPEKRNLYDETGSIDGIEDDLDTKSFNTAYMFYRSLYKEITKEDIDSFAVRYRNSKEEIDDLIEYYEEFEGDVRKLLECIPLSINEDVDRFIKIIDRCIKEGRLKKTAQYTKTKTKVKLLKNKRRKKGLKRKRTELRCFSNLHSFVQLFVYFFLYLFISVFQSCKCMYIMTYFILKHIIFGLVFSHLLDSSVPL